MKTRDYVHLIIFLSTISVLCSVSFSASLFQENEQDKMTLLALKDKFFAEGGSSYEGSALTSWNNTLHFCQWEGIICGTDQRVTRLSLVDKNLNGILSPSVGNLTFLTGLNLSENSLHGEIPKEIGFLRRLKYLYLTGNYIQGAVPVEVSNCSNLEVLSLGANNLTGKIPFQLGSLVKLTFFAVHENNLVGVMPSFLRNLSSLSMLELSENCFTGEIQYLLQGLTKLSHLSLRQNSFSGTISGLYNLSSLTTLDLGFNNFSRTLKPDIDVAFRKATFLRFANNNFTGTVPTSVSNISGLEVFEVAYNRFTGIVPNTLGNLKSLKILQLYSNPFGSGKSTDLGFIDSLSNCTNLRFFSFGLNQCLGQLPTSISNLTSQLQRLWIGETSITGPIPEGIVNLHSLSALSLINNLLIGVIPTSIGKLANLSRLRLSGNKLHGEIPSSIGNLTILYELFLQDNSLAGNIPRSLENYKGMQNLDISSNNLQGSLPVEVFNQFERLLSCNISNNFFSETFPSAFGELENLNLLDASKNKFSGLIPSQLGEATGLVILSMAGNLFGGSIPESFGNLKGLEVLDLSNNNFSGIIPEGLANIISLRILNLSLNQLEGEVPIFQNVSSLSIYGNNRLCGGNSELKLPPCEHVRKGRKGSQKVAIAIIVTLLALFILLVLLFIFRSCKNIRKDEPDSVEEGLEADSVGDGYLRVTYKELYTATDGFAESNLIGKGSFGEVYKGNLKKEDQKLVAVKVITLSTYGARKGFTSECKVLTQIRHRNLLKIVTSCSSLDYKGNEFKALVYEYMSNGNLDTWLHFRTWQQGTKVLSLEKRMDVAIDVASALDYLHNGCQTLIVHCDLKPSNILLDEDMVAHVGDFGLARLLPTVSENFRVDSLTTVMKGSIGYIPPEYGMGGKISPQGDIYSYGILLLELITGRRPTDDKFNNGMSLQYFCQRAIRDHIEEFMDPLLMTELQNAMDKQWSSDQEKRQYRALLVSFVEVGISCAAESSKNRMDIRSAINCLKGIKENFSSLLAWGDA